jgi:hypothetical protein
MSEISKELDRLRLKAFKTNSPSDKQAYYDALSRAFQRGELVEASVSPAIGEGSRVELEEAEAAIAELIGGAWNARQVGDIHGWSSRAKARVSEIFSALRSPPEPVSGEWPDFSAPPKYENPAKGWTDPRLPDFRLIWATARSAGYSVGLHGSMKRDCDLIAAPWVEDSASPEDLISALCAALNARQVGEIEQKPLGRVAVTLQINGFFKPIDLSIAPRVSPRRDAPEPVASTHEERIALAQALTWDINNISPDEVLEIIDRLAGQGFELRRISASPPDGELVRMREALDDLCKLTFAVQHNPNCPAPWLVRLPGKGPIDMKPYGDPLGRVPHQTGDILGFGKTFDEAARAALSVKGAK